MLKRLQRPLPLFLLLLLAAAAPLVTACGRTPVCTEACARAEECLARIGIPVEDIYAQCVIPCSVQNPVWKACVLSCDVESSCIQYGLCLFGCGYWR